MKTIYIDSEFKCYLFNDGNMISIETDYFDDKCDAFIEGYRFIPSGESWTRSDGTIFYGEMISPWKNYIELDTAQRTYELEKLRRCEMELAELDAVLLEIQYQNLVEGL